MGITAKYDGTPTRLVPLSANLQGISPLRLSQHGVFAYAMGALFCLVTYLFTSRAKIRTQKSETHAGDGLDWSLILSNLGIG